MARKREKPTGSLSMHKMPSKRANATEISSVVPDSQFVLLDTAKRGIDLPIEEFLEFHDFLKAKRWEKLCEPSQSGVTRHSLLPCSSSEKISQMAKQKPSTRSKRTSQSQQLHDPKQQVEEQQECLGPCRHSPRGKLCSLILASTGFYRQPTRELELEDPRPLVIEDSRAGLMPHPSSEQVKNVELPSDLGGLHPSGEEDENIKSLSSNSQLTQQTRGKAINMGLMTLIKRNKGCIPIVIKDGSCVGPYAKYVPREIGIRVREYFPIAKRGFSEVEKDKLIELITYLKENFEFKSVTSEEVEEYVKRTANATYRCFRAKCAKHYHEVIGRGQDPTTCPIKDWMQSNDEWKQLCEYFGSEEFQKRSKTCMENRAKVRFIHKCGSQSFADRRDQMDLNLIEGFKECYTDQQGRWVSERLKEYYNQMKEREVGAAWSNSSIKQQEILAGVLGQKSGYCRGVGGGLKATKKMRMGNVSASSMPEVMEENQQLREEIKELKEKISEIMVAHQFMLNMVRANLKGPLPPKLQRRTDSFQFPNLDVHGDRDGDEDVDGEDGGGDDDDDDDRDDEEEDFQP